jgi:APA family basic amino acid/polyamine antiporter
MTEVPPKLKKELGLLDVFCIASGAMISSGLFILPGLAHAQAGPAVFVSYLLAGLLAMTGMLSQAELVSAMPKAGGTYFYVTRTMGPAVGTVDGIMTWFSLSLKSALALVGMAAFGALIFNIVPGTSEYVFWTRTMGISLVLVFLVVNLFGAKEAARIQVVLVFGLMAVLLLYIFKGLPAMDLKLLAPFVKEKEGYLSIIGAAGFVFISYGGLLKVASLAEEVKRPARVIPLGMILSLVVVTLMYMLVVLVTAGVLEADKLDNSLMPISDGAAAFMGRPGMIALSIAAMLAFISTANAGIMAASRYPLALARDSLLPERLAHINRRFQTPHISIVITCLLMIGALFLELGVLVKVASTVLILTFMFSCLSLIILRESRLQNYQPRFKAPLYPWVQIIGIAGFGFLLYEIGKEAYVASLLLIVSGLFVYWFYGRIRASREYALLHLIERITARELTTRSLETELKEIIRERDDITKDRFDHIIEKSCVLDFEESMTSEELFKQVAGSLAAELDLTEEQFLQKLKEREEESSTVITPCLAIPHIVVEGEGKFNILLARNRKGVRFSEENAEVHAVFVLVGTRDERNFHLRALSAIAQIVQDPVFEKRWLAARGDEGLRDAVLLGERRRQTVIDKTAG